MKIVSDLLLMFFYCIDSTCQQQYSVVTGHYVDSVLSSSHCNDCSDGVYYQFITFTAKYGGEIGDRRDCALSIPHDFLPQMNIKQEQRPSRGLQLYINGARKYVSLSPSFTYDDCAAYKKTLAEHDSLTANGLLMMHVDKKGSKVNGGVSFYPELVIARILY